MTSLKGNMEAIIKGRACAAHPACPRPCLECAGSVRAVGDAKHGGYRGGGMKFDDSESSGDPPSANDDSMSPGLGKERHLRMLGLTG